MSEFIKIENFERREWKAGDELPPCINYACGLKPIAGDWLNTDYFDGSLLWHFKDTGVPQELASSIFNIDLLARHPFPNCSFQYAYCEDFIEHIDQKSSLLFLAEVWRTLKPEGILRISTPSLDGVLKRHFWTAGRDHVEQEIPGAFDAWGHVHFYSHESLEKVATALGFGRYERCKFGKSK